MDRMCRRGQTIDMLSAEVEKLETENKELKQENYELSIYRKALDKWGNLQVLMIFEEMAELQKELCKSLRGKENRLKIAEEIADVEIMLGQMKIFFGIDEAVKRQKVWKLIRLGNKLTKKTK